MKCAICGKEFEGNPHAKRKPKYCSPACKQKAYELRKKMGAQPERKHPKPTVKVSVGKNVDAELDKDTFERMRDGTLLDTLRFNRDILQKALASPETPPSALAAISKQHVDVCRQIEQLEQADDDLILESEDMNDDTVLEGLI